MMEQNVFFSVCITSYNRADLISRCLNSLENQTFQSFEVLFIDDGSTDNTESVIRNYKHDFALRYIKKANGGKHTAINRALDEAKGYMFMILDSDDWLSNNALQELYDKWSSFSQNEKDKLCGIIGKCANQFGEICGKNFPKELKQISYIDFHFGIGIKVGGFGDCIECVKTEIINKYRFPEPSGTKFVPEFYIFDQIGCHYFLACFNDIWEIKEYQENGITLNSKQHMKENVIGYLEGAICRLEKVIPQCPSINLKAKREVWRYYWMLVDFDQKKMGKRVKHVSLIGWDAFFRYNLKKLVKSFK